MPEAALHAPLQTPSGTVLAFDFGEKRIGVAIGETLLGQAHPLTTLPAPSNQERFGATQALLDEWRPVLLVVGLPVSLDGEAHAMTARCTRFANQLRGRFNLPVAYADERLTSLDAEERLRETGHSAKTAKAHLDAVAAQLILQSYFDAH